MSSNLSIALIIGASVAGAVAGIRRVQSNLTILRDSSLAANEKVRMLGINATKSFATLASLAWWFGFTPCVLEEMTLEDIERWYQQADRQVKAHYNKAIL